MSYDLRLFARKPGEDPILTARRASGELPTTPPDAAKEAEKRRLADVLMLLNPNLKPFAFGHKEIAEFEGTTVEQARLKWRHIELNGPENSDGIQITIFDEMISLTVPYWHTGAKATNVFREIWSYLELLEREADHAIYDPQLACILNLRRDFDAVLSRYMHVAGQIKGHYPF